MFICGQFFISEYCCRYYLFDQIIQNIFCAIYWLWKIMSDFLCYKNSAVYQGKICEGLKEIFELRFNTSCARQYKSYSAKQNVGLNTHLGLSLKYNKWIKPLKRTKLSGLILTSPNFLLQCEQKTLFWQKSVVLSVTSISITLEVLVNTELCLAVLTSPAGGRNLCSYR